MNNELEKFVYANREAFDDEQPSARIGEEIEKQFGEKALTDDRLEKFVKANREVFDNEQPSEMVWQTLEKQFGEKQPAKVIPFRRNVIRIMSAAAALIVVALGVWYVVSTKPAQQNTAKTNPVDTSATKTLAQVTPPAAQQAPITVTQPKDTADNNNTATTMAPEDEQKQEIYYYAKLTEIKFNQLKRMEKDEPLLYKSFAGEIKKLDSAYHGLQTMLNSGHADNEAILNAMLTNLKMQAEILNKQLYIIHSLKQSKKSKYENNNYPSI